MDQRENQARLQAIIKQRLARLPAQEREALLSQAKRLPPADRAQFIARWLRGEVSLGASTETATSPSDESKIHRLPTRPLSRSPAEPPPIPVQVDTEAALAAEPESVAPHPRADLRHR